MIKKQHRSTDFALNLENIGPFTPLHFHSTYFLFAFELEGELMFKITKHNTFALHFPVMLTYDENVTCTFHTFISLQYKYLLRSHEKTCSQSAYHTTAYWFYKWDKMQWSAWQMFLSNAFVKATGPDLRLLCRTTVEIECLISDTN